MVYYDDYLKVGRQRLDFFCEFAAEGGIVVARNVGDYVHREHPVLLGIVEAVDLERASLRLLTASITMATLLAIMPTTALNAASKTLATIPMTLVRMI